MTARSAVRSQRTNLRISGKNLGAYALPDACERCLWIKGRLKHRTPFSVFPGIFSTIDSFSKLIVHDYFDHHGQPPTWLKPLGDVVGYREPPHWSRFQVLDEEHGILVTGAPDGVFVCRDGTYLIIDYKTARHTKTQDVLFPMYEVQLNVYAMIAERIGFAPVTGLALVYTEPQTDVLNSTAKAINRAGFRMPFTAFIVPVERKPEIVSPLLGRVRRLLDRSSPPRPLDGCRDCRQVDELLDLFGVKTPWKKKK